MPEPTALVVPASLLVQLTDGQIKEIELDEYLRGVVPAEMGLKKPIEALKAQAISARSFAVATRRHALEGFDVCTSAHCQVYKPEKRYADADRAVADTSGQVVTHKNRLVGVHFFAHCDGRTRNSEDVWSGAVAYLRSVPCNCGYTSLLGHGAGMCQRGAAAMAEEGADCQTIIKHYYTGVEVGQADTIPRTEYKRSMVLGRVLDDQGQPQSGLSLVLAGPKGRVEKGTIRDGRFFFTQLPAGHWDLEVEGTSLRFPDLFTDGRNAMELKIILPDLPVLDIEAVPLAHPRHLAGTLGYDGLLVTLIDPDGNNRTVVSGSAPLYDPGGFAFPLSSLVGTYTLRIAQQRFDVQVGGQGLWVRFKPKTA